MKDTEFELNKNQKKGDRIERAGPIGRESSSERKAKIHLRIRTKQCSLINQ